MTLDDYRRKRDFSDSPEPEGNGVIGASASNLRYVIQKHAARSLHFDLRLELNGVLKSWAVPRGPSLHPSEKRLAVEVEDHPIEYADFEGVIPKGHYGAGRVILWDTGSWHPHGDVQKMMLSGKLKFRLSGQRLRGDWTLIRTRMKGTKQQWLLSKRNDEEARTDIDVVEQYIDSVVQGDTKTLAAPLPDFIKPKLPTLAAAPPFGDGWVHELKMDGYRMQAQWRSDGFRLLTRSGQDWTLRYRAVSDELSKLGFTDTIIDGELVALDDEGKSNFDLLQDAKGRQGVALAYFAFDLMFSGGKDLREQPLSKRKEALRSLIMTPEGPALSPRLQYLDHITSGVDALVKQCQSLGLEGIVSKRMDRGYASGRAGDWLKTKFRFREFLVVVGYEISGKPPALSSLLMGYFDGNELKFAGRVGTGWSENAAEQIVARLQPLRADTTSLSAAPRTAKRVREGEIAKVWVQPILVAAIDFATWTQSQQLRHASFAGFAEEISPQEVTAAQLFASSVVESATDPTRQGDLTNPTTDSLPTIGMPGLSNPGRILYPQSKFTKGDIAGYLFQVNQWLLPHLQHRPVSLLRCSEGIEGQTFFQRHPGKGFPTQISNLVVASEDEPLITIDHLSALLATAQISAIELHPWGCRDDSIEIPDRLIIDLDPDEAIAWNVVVEAAFIVRSTLKDQSLESFVKTTGGKGLHIVVPLNRHLGWDQLFAYAKSFATQLAKTHRKLFVANMSKSRRTDRIFVDYHRNRRGSTAIAAYSPRAREGGPVSTPITWQELPGIHPSQFTIRTVPTRLANLNSDPWAAIASLEQSIEPVS